ncbi:MAG: DUF4878 domain-containing protein [Kiritimatiellae bacterium]|nr:DUF4878 domain-containing protein [Kiritimatiellia bacterium]
MKIVKILAIALCACAMFTVTGCNRNTPGAVVVRVLEGLRDGKADADFLKANCTEGVAALFALAGDEAKKEMEGTKFKVVEEKIDGDTAKVKVKITGGKDGKEETETFDAKKVDGKWKFDLKK